MELSLRKSAQEEPLTYRHLIEVEFGIFDPVEREVRKTVEEYEGRELYSNYIEEIDARHIVFWFDSDSASKWYQASEKLKEMFEFAEIQSMVNRWMVVELRFGYEEVENELEELWDNDYPYAAGKIPPPKEHRPYFPEVDEEML